MPDFGKLELCSHILLAFDYSLWRPLDLLRAFRYLHKKLARHASSISCKKLILQNDMPLLSLVLLRQNLLFEMLRVHLDSLLQVCVSHGGNQAVEGGQLFEREVLSVVVPHCGFIHVAFQALF